MAFVKIQIGAGAASGSARRREIARRIIQGLAIALQCGATKAQLDATVGIHPTAAEEFVTMRDPIPDPPHRGAI